ncbi:hypothetical protein [Sphingobacterium ginsenosidimutans]|uniref:Lipocalin-like domain-containing protein n=1 Tax=Sphingobacterium ginsenosidimutans TaxID=687845 RepID=A0ABP7ZWF0_9SPHI
MLISCDKESRSEFATGISEKGILGRWKLVETTSSNGTAGLNKVDMSSENYIVTFYSNGKIEAPDFPCSGEYFFEKNKAGDDGDHKLSASFDKCKSSQALWYTINGNADARIVDHNNLILNSKTCDEPCTRIYRRLKE